MRRPTTRSRPRLRTATDGLPVLLVFGVVGGGSLVGGCTAPDPDFAAPPASPASILDFTDEAEQRGLVNRVHDGLDAAWDGQCFLALSSVVANDIDHDGDADLLYWNQEGFPALYLNDGAARFDEHVVERDIRGRFGRETTAFAVADLNGDGRPDIVATGLSMLLVSWGQDDLKFSEFEALYWRDDYPLTCFSTLAVGDVDGDGDLDVLLPGADHLLDESSAYTESFPAHGSPNLLLLNDGGGFDDVLELVPAGAPNLSILGAFTDRDGDGDLDVLVTADRTSGPADGGGPTAFYRNDGPGPDGRPRFVDEGPALGFASWVHGMGLDTFDFNGDDVIDYCISDVVPSVRCFVSLDGGYVERGLALGLSVPPPPGHDDWAYENGFSGWSIELAHLDNDEHVDAVLSGVNEPGREPDTIWRGSPGGFEVVPDAFDPARDAPNFGLALADFAGDGTLDIATDSGELWMSGPSEAAWLQVELVGQAGNPEGIGARVRITAGDRVELREVHALRTFGQSDSIVHLGLGSRQAVDRVEVSWPDGAVSVAENVEARQRFVLRHPDAP